MQPAAPPAPIPRLPSGIEPGPEIERGRSRSGIAPRTIAEFPSVQHRLEELLSGVGRSSELL
jgi:hypothetical protein